MRPIAARIAALHGEGALVVFARARELERQGRSIIHLELGEPDFHPPAPVIEALNAALAQGRDRYCAAQGLPALRDELAQYLARTRGLDVSGDQIVIAPGCKNALFFALMALVEPGDEVLFPEPGFPGYPSITRGLGGVAVPFELSERNQLQPDPDEIAARITPRTKVLITNSPGNPTGTVYTDAVQRRLAELAVEHDLYVVSDEIYARVIYGDALRSMRSYPGMAARTLIVDGFSKSFAMTGWRLGYTVAPPPLVPALDLLAVNSYVCVAEFTQLAAIEALRDREHATPRMVAEFHRRRDQFVHGLAQIPGFRCALPGGAFYAWVNVTGTGLSAEEVCRILLEQVGVAALPGAAFGPLGNDFVRFSFASSTALLAEAIERIRQASSGWQRTAGR